MVVFLTCVFGLLVVMAESRPDRTTNYPHFVGGHLTPDQMTFRRDTRTSRPVSVTAQAPTDGSLARVKRTATEPYSVTTTTTTESITDFTGVTDMESPLIRVGLSTTSKTLPSYRPCVCSSNPRIHTRSIYRNHTSSVATIRRAAVVGTIGRVSLLSNIYADSLFRCFLFCVQNSWCFAFSYTFQQDMGGNCMLSKHECPNVNELPDHYVYCIHS